MGDGMIRAARATIATRQWKVTDWDQRGKVEHVVTGEQALAVLDAMPAYDAMLAAIPGAIGFADRRFDRVLQALRRAGLASYDRKTKTWNRTGDAS